MPPRKQSSAQNQGNVSLVTPKTTKITRTSATPEGEQSISTPLHKRLPLKQRNINSISYMVKPQKQTVPRNQHHYLPVSPVAAKDLSPRMAKILKHTGLECYSGIFQREEIDLFAYQYISLSDLKKIGITNKKHCDIILGAKNYFH